MAEKLAFLDFDGTLSSGYVSMAFLDYVHEHGLYDAAEYQKQMQYVADVKAGRLSYNDWLPAWATSWGAGLRGRSHEEVMDAAEEFFQGFKHHIYPSSFEVVDLFRCAGYRPLVLSVGAYEVVSLAARELGVKDAIGTKIGIDTDGIYTGQVVTRLHTPAGKMDWLRELLADEGIPSGECAACGDSAHDVPMLAAVGHAFCLNPSAELEKEALERGWPSLTHESAVQYLSGWLQRV